MPYGPAVEPLPCRSGDLATDRWEVVCDTWEDSSAPVLSPAAPSSPSLGPLLVQSGGAGGSGSRNSSLRRPLGPGLDRQTSQDGNSPRSSSLCSPEASPPASPASAGHQRRLRHRSGGSLDLENHTAGMPPVPLATPAAPVTPMGRRRFASVDSNPFAMADARGLPRSSSSSSLTADPPALQQLPAALPAVPPAAVSSPWPQQRSPVFVSVGLAAVDPDEEDEDLGAD